MDIKIVPYCEVDGIRTMSDSFVRSLWKRMEAEGKSRFFSGSIYFQSADDFLQEMKHSSTMFYLVKSSGGNAGCFWLNYFQEKFCQAHYFFFREYWGRTRKIGLEVFGQVLSWKDDDGYALDMLTGILDKDNSLAVKLAGKCGWQKAGELPMAKYDLNTKNSRPGIIVYLTRENLRRVK